jgi:NAD(P)-dependent dehydrogenase (short-subunit alcohol dehydrogenase family)
VNGKNALVLGATGRLGQAIVSRFVSNDIRVVGVARRKVIVPGQMDNSLFTLITGDVTSPSFFKTLERKLRARKEYPDILIHAVGKYSSDVLSKQALLEVLETNLVSAEYAIRTFGPGMCAKGYGRIVIVSSMSAVRGSRSSIYAASKAGLRGLVLSVASQYARKGVTINTVLAGPVESPMLRDNCDAQRREAYLREIPMGRFGKPEEICSVVCFLASPEASFITGTEIPVSGGLR